MNYKQALSSGQKKFTLLERLDEEGNKRVFNDKEGFIFLHPYERKQSETNNEQLHTTQIIYPVKLVYTGPKIHNVSYAVQTRQNANLLPLEMLRTRRPHGASL